MRVRPLLACAAVALVAVVVSRVLASPVRADPTAVSGTVTDAAGRAIPRIGIVREGYRDRSGVTPWWTTDVDGRFRVAGLPPGEVVLRVIPGEPDVRTGELVRTQAGTVDLTIVVDPGPQLFLRIVGYQAPDGDPRHARLVWRETDGRRVVRYSPIRADGWIRFVRLPADRDLELWAGAAPGKPVRRKGLRAGDTEVRVEPVVGHEIRGRIVLSPGDRATNVGVAVRARLTDADDDFFDVGGARVNADGSFVVTGLPEGTYRLAAGFESGAISLPVTADVKAGATDVVLDLRR